MLVRASPWLMAAAVFCLLAWASVGFTGLKLTEVYQHRDGLSFRHALEARLDRRADWLRALMTGGDRLS